MPDERLTPRQVAAELGVTVRTVQRWIVDGRLPAERVGSRVRVSRSSLARVASGSVGSATTIRRLLVANRGEIVERVARSAHRLGIEVIGVHGADERPPSGVDEAHVIGSYLDADEIVGVATRAGAGAIHPGYGFLAESPAFAAAVANAGLAWVGPPAEAIAAMGDKAAARRRASELGVPVVPGYDGDGQDDASLTRAAERVGFPLLVKPSAGGGGKGMRTVRAASELVEALATARREALRSFDDDRLVLERYLEGSRHVEVQVLFDGHGSGVHLGERDCSAQRRRQKIVEEAPAPSVSAELRQRMGEAALAVASGIGYASAGTVEMLLADDGAFFFLEMNTRLQVEHPVTEAVTGRDLVADQLRIATGASLADIGMSGPPPIEGHAIEARVYAEDPETGFLPATGFVELLHWPEGVRVDTGIVEGDRVSDRFDPMLAKVIAHGATRDEALRRLGRALDETRILGVRTNLRFLRWLVAQPQMRDAEMRTDTLERIELPRPPILEEDHWQAAALTVPPPSTPPWNDGWRLNAQPVRRLRAGDEERSVALPRLSADAGGWTWSGPLAIKGRSAIHVEVDGQSVDFTPAPPPTIEEAVRHASTGPGGGAATLTAPMPGRVIALRVAPGSEVRAQQVIVVIEAMKMEHAVVAPIDGVLSRIEVTEGQQVQRGDLLGEVKPASGA